MILEKRLLKIKFKFLFSLQTLSQTFLILRRTEGDMVKYVHGASCKVHIILARFYEN
jgi:polyphosphate kinase